MKVLIISNNPGRASFRQRLGIHLPIFNQFGIQYEIAKIPRGFWERKKLFKRAIDFDAVFLHKNCFNFFDAHWIKKYSKKIIYDFDDAVMYSFKMPSQWRYSHWQPFKRTVRMANLVVAGNSYLAGIAKKYNSNVITLPTGLDTEKFKFIHAQKDDKIRLVWIGSKATIRYLREIKEPLEKLGQQNKNIILRIISDEFMNFNNIEVEEINWTLENEAKDLVECDIGLAPLPDNNFTRGKCGFKILQYMAASLPVVASPVGINCDLIKNGVNGFLASKSTEWFNSILQLSNDISLRQRMGRVNSHDVKQFDYKVTGKDLYNLIVHV